MIEIKDEDYGGRGFACRDLEGHIWSVGARTTLGIRCVRGRESFCGGRSAAPAACHFAAAVLRRRPRVILRRPFCGAGRVSFCGGRFATPAALQIEVRSQGGQRVAGRVDSLGSRKRIENDFAAFRRQFVDALLDGEGAELDQRPAFGPDAGRIVDLVPAFGQLNQDPQIDRPLRQPLGEFGRQKIGRFRRDLFGVRNSVPASGTMRNRPKRL